MEKNEMKKEKKYYSNGQEKNPLYKKKRPKFENGYKSHIKEKKRPKGILYKNGISIYQLDKTRRKIDAVKHAINTVLANSCYHTKNIEEQIARAENKTGNFPDDERILLEKAWDFRHKQAKELAIMLDQFINDDNKKITAESEKKESSINEIHKRKLIDHVSNL
jgi:hypothetical protein